MADLLAPHQSTASKLREMLKNEDEIVVCPGVYDGFTARLALNAGFKILYMVCFLHLFICLFVCLFVCLF